MIAALQICWMATLLVLGSTASASAQELDYPRRHYDHRDGLPQNTVNDIVQDPQGFLWIATFGGLARFDGFNFEVFDIGSRNDLPSNRIFRLCLDPTGGLWVGTQDAGLLHFDGEVFKPIKASAGNEWGLIQALQYHRGALWIGHDFGLSRWQDGRCDTFRFDGTPANVHCLFVDHRDQLWAGTSLGLVAVAEQDGEVRFDGPHFDGAVHQIWQDDDQRLLFSVGPWIEALSDGFRSSRIWDGDRTGHPWSQARVPGSETWLGGYHLTVLRGSSKSDLQVDQLEKLPGVPYRKLFIDREANVWVGTSGAGLYSLSPKSYTQLQCHGPQSSKPTVRLCVDNGNGQPLCLLDYLVVADVDRRELVEDPSLPRQTVTETKISGLHRRGEEVFLAAERGLLRYRSGGNAEVLIDGDVSGILPSHSGALWTGGYGFIHQFRDGEVERHAVPGLTGLVTPVQETEDGAIWLVTRSEVARFSADDLTIWNQADGIAGPIRTLFVDEEDRVWVSSYGRGLSFISGETIGRLTAQNGLSDDSLGAILPGSQGALWINSNRGVFSLSGAELDDFVAGRSDRVHALKINSGEGNGASGFKAPDGTLWFPTVEGLVGIDPEAIKNTTPQITTIIGSVSIDAELQPTTDDLVINSDDNSIGISYSAIHLRNPSELRFRYRLVGADEGWTLAGSRREAFFGGLAPGDYEFQVETTIAGFPWSENPASLRFSVEPRLHQSMLFWLVVGAIVVALVLFVFSLRIKKLEAEHQRTTEFMARSAQQSEDRLRVEKELEEAKRFETVGRLAGSIAHDFNNILMAQMGHAELIRFEDGSDARERIKEHVAEIIRSSNRAARLVRKIMDFSQDHRKKLRPVRLHVVLDRVVPFLGPLLPANIRLSVNLALDARAMEVDESASERLLLNLVLNARDAMPQGGKIEVKAELLDASEIVARGHDPAGAGRHLCLSVSDDGQGIATEHLDSIFDSFFTTKTRGKGTGLGLVTVKSVVDEAHGFIRVDTTVDVGTRFSVYLPDSQPTRAAESESAGAS